ncbi:MAG: NAD(P)-dependent oxidoreductase [Caldilineaceae bacterium]
MSSLIVVHADFETHWPFVGEEWCAVWREQKETAFIRLPRGNTQRLGEVVQQPGEVTCLACLGVPVTVDCLQGFTQLQEAAFPAIYGPSKLVQPCVELLQQRQVKLYDHRSEGFWGQSVSEFALALTLCALRQIPQNYHAMLSSHEPWTRYQPARNQGPQTLGAQFSDNLNFTCGAVAGKRVRIVGAGNIGSRYASFVHALGADVAIWDPYATEPGFHRAGAQRVWHLEELVKDAEIFAPMLPLKDDTRGVVTAAHIDALPKGCLVVLATRALICDMQAIRRRVLADELALAADVFDVEPLPLDDPLLGRANVVHTPHLAGRTRDANRQWVQMLTAQFRPN